MSDESVEPKKTRARLLLWLRGPLAEKQIETQKVRVGKREYEYPSPEAVDAELLKMSTMMSGRDAFERLAFERFSERLVGKMKEGRAALILAGQHAERNYRQEGQAHWSDSDLRIARGLFKDAQSILNAYWSQDPEEMREIFDDRSPKDTTH
ncbi:hypothetical protein A3A39_02785 [Candidatus Kaiserbacteria bacterium RIFCSPLOWO2_01_FULL_54_13]|uniref:Uncharacterized protein n=1 Tax=Candidatus Kaiserbacteria bacterium RIFCSPLOWO2_01_FULL_54_13 TaxID=1798512 RepID=A0A1F6F2K4_9BACT|nr:MAG: hypothetical protein A3A39_02785 [Candidatus Kaiserbacteria bacterium RIFCSPLOWO2_01_FULL_54_13]